MKLDGCCRLSCPTSSQPREWGVKPPYSFVRRCNSAWDVGIHSLLSILLLSTIPAVCRTQASLPVLSYFQKSIPFPPCITQSRRIGHFSCTLPTLPAGTSPSSSLFPSLPMHIVLPRGPYSTQYRYPNNLLASARLGLESGSRPRTPSSQKRKEGSKQKSGNSTLPVTPQKNKMSFFFQALSTFCARLYGAWHRGQGGKEG